jgi:hypothetical protein
MAIPFEVILAVNSILALAGKRCRISFIVNKARAEMKLYTLEHCFYHDPMEQFLSLF